MARDFVVVVVVVIISANTHLISIKHTDSTNTAMELRDGNGAC